MASQVIQPRASSPFDYKHHTKQEHKPSELLVFICEKEKNSDNVIIRNGDSVHYILKRQLFGKKYTLTSGDSNSSLIRAVTHRAVGYITLKSMVFAIHFNLSFPKFPRGVYTFEIDGVQYLWDYEMGSHMRCFTVQDTKLVAQIFSNSMNPSEESGDSIAWNARLAMVKEVTVSSGTLALITMTGLLLMKKQIW
ncbi:hypothetical protein K7432_013575 [Basidiobolus ranarum]|uniref:Uncharacterized protein n=1 Tax=Basidiobolus ranarum TaxID=34480 RepID=A0ABR2WJ00_9FUNG